MERARDVFKRLDAPEAMSAWKCPKCGAGAHRHGAGGEEACKSYGECEGLLCECFEHGAGEGSDDPDHGLLYSNPCKHAACHHCGWGGVMPWTTTCTPRRRGCAAG
jgi:hypothetical protein